MLHHKRTYFVCKRPLGSSASRLLHAHPARSFASWTCRAPQIHRQIERHDVCRFKCHIIATRSKLQSRLLARTTPAATLIDSRRPTSRDNETRPVSGNLTTLRPTPPPLSRPTRRSVPQFSVWLDQLRLGLNFPLSELAVLSLSAVLQFRHVSDRPGTAPFTLSSLSPATEHSTYPNDYDMLVDEKNTPVEGHETKASSHPLAPIEPTTSQPPPPDYAQAVGTSAPPLVNDFKYRLQQPGTSTDAARDASGPKETIIPAAANYVHVFKRDGSIQGQWNINPSLVVPPALLLSDQEREEATATTSNWAFTKKKPKTGDEAKEEPANLTLHTRDGRIQADVWIADSNEGDASKEEEKSTRLDLLTRDGGILLRVRTHGTRPLHIRAYTHDGHIRIFLPRSFSGLVQHEIHDGKLVFSPAMHSSASTFSMVDGKRGTSFVGDWQAAMKGGEAALGDWRGDRCEATSRDGSLYFFWEDEFEAEWARRKSSWFKALFM